MSVTKRSISFLKTQAINTDKEKKTYLESGDETSCFGIQDMRVKVINTLQHYPEHFTSHQIKSVRAQHFTKHLMGFLDPEMQTAFIGAFDIQR